MGSRRDTFRFILAGGAALGVLVAVPAAQAEDAQKLASNAGASDSATTVQEMVVTANKREEKLHDVALAVSALSGDDLELRQELDIADISRQVPGFSVQRQGPTLNRLIIRGENSGGSGATVGVVVDDVPFSFASSTGNGSIVVADVDPWDISRVEVLRGPQGTLYGAGAEGGLVKYETTPPHLGRYEAGAEAGFDSVAGGDTVGDGKAYINLPLGDKIAVRASGYYEGQPGYIRNPLSGQTDINHGYKYGGRFTVLLQPTPDLTIKASTFYQKLKIDASGDVDIEGAPNGPPGPSNQLSLIEPLSYGTYVPEGSDIALNNNYLAISYDFRWATLHSITSYGSIGGNATSDLTGNPLAPGLYYGPYLGAVVYGQPIALGETEHDSLDKYSQEFRLSSDPGLEVFGHNLELQGGVFVTREVTSIKQTFNAFAQTNLSTPLKPALGDALAPGVYHEVSGFGEADLHITPTIDISGGVRVSNVTQHYYTDLSPGILTGSGGASATTYSQQTSTTFSVAPRWHITDDTLVYARIASGFRPGGPVGAIAGAPPGFPTSYQSDSTINYEAGVRSYFFNRKLSVDVAGYYIDWSDIQILTSFKAANGVGFTYTGNAGSAQSHGVEYTVSWAPAPGLTFSDTGSWTDAALTKDAPGIGALSGQSLAFVPDFNNTLNADYERPAFGDYKGFVGVSWSYIGRQYTNFGTSPLLENHFRLPSYDTEDLRAGVRDDRYTVEVFVRNLADSHALVGYNSLSAAPPGGLGSAVILQPRTFGLRVTAKY